MNILIWSCFWTFHFSELIVFSSFNKEAQKKGGSSQGMTRDEGRLPSLRPQQGRQQGHLPPKNKKKQCSMVESTSQEQTLTSDQVQEESECGEFTQDVSLEPWDVTLGPSTDIAIVNVKSPDVSHSEGQSEPEEEESIREPLVCASHDLPRCTIDRMSADMLHYLKEMEKIKKAATALQRRIRDFVDMLAKL
ncbi:hypothetical protein AB205_0161340 [Aquarana catesbeiana]|uniref:Uncharacterized protein n=1 Tax=Aquarana catesbeiana TaxID=8400 RepID=A0A2G9RXY6_AQUCT|nr:hypothetical protein AB205_0161340 [Aquarana catesbeiana]